MMTTKEQNNLLTLDGYFAEFYTLCGDYPDKKYYEVWMKLEDRMMARYGICRYQKYGAFKMAKSRYQKR